MASRKSFEKPQTNEQAEEKLIQSNNFGGLNTTASALNVPYEDTPFTLNTIINVDGTVSKRKGTRVIQKLDVADSAGFTLTSITTNKDYNLIVEKSGTFLKVHEVSGDVLTFIFSKPNVFSNEAFAIKPSVVVTSEVNPRVIMCTGVNRPVQLLFQESQAITTSTTTSVIIPNAWEFWNSFQFNTVVYINRVRQNIATPSYSFNATTGELTVSSLPSMVAGTVVDLIKVTWQHWTEAQTYLGRHFYNTATRFNVVRTDQNVAIPADLLTDLEPTRNNNNYNLTVYSQASRGTAFTKNNTSNPQLSNEYSFGDGTVYYYTATNFVRSSPFFVTFGALDPSGLPTAVYYSRRRIHTFNGGTTLQANQVDVYNRVDNSRTAKISGLIAPSGNAADSVYGSHFCMLDGIVNTSPTNQCDGVVFEAITLGLPSTATTEIANNSYNSRSIGTSANNTWVYAGNSAGTNYTGYADGNYHMAYGFGQYCDYLSNYYPSTVGYYQGRLVFGGFIHRPLTLLFSEVEDSTIADRKYSSYMVGNTWVGDNYAFDVTIIGDPDDYIVGTVEWQGSLFALTRKAVYKITGYGNTALSPSSRSAIYVSNVGCVNNKSFVKTDFNVLYLSDKGLYDIQPIVENGEYTVKELSIKIRDKFGITINPDYELLPFMEYDHIERLVYVGYPGINEFYTTKYLYVYNTYRQSWSEYDTPRGFNLMGSTTYVDRSLGFQFMSYGITKRTGGVPVDLVFIRWNSNIYLDFIQFAVHTAGFSYPLFGQPLVTHTISNGVRLLPIIYQYSRQVFSFMPVPFDDVADLVVKRNGFLLTQGIDYVKQEAGFIYIIGILNNGDTVTISPSPQLNNTEIYYGIVVNGADIIPPTYTNGNTFTLSSATVGDFVFWGNNYLTVYSTPQFLSGDLTSLKRSIRSAVYLDNRERITRYISNFKLAIDANLTFSFNSSQSSITKLNITGNDSLYWEDSTIDPSSGSDVYQNGQLITSLVSGLGYSVSISLWNYTSGYFKFGAYQLDVQQKGDRTSGANY
jgi:hypothetical protein